MEHPIYFEFCYIQPLPILNNFLQNKTICFKIRKVFSCTPLLLSDDNDVVIQKNKKMKSGGRFQYMP